MFLSLRTKSIWCNNR